MWPVILTHCNLDSAKKIGQSEGVFAVFKSFGRATGIFLWLVGALVLAELVGRLVSDVFILSIDNLIARELSPLRWANGPLIFDDKLGWRLKPRGQYGGQGRPDGKLTIGALGLRGAPYEMRRIPKQAILAVGEAATLGVNIDDAETWPAQLAALLQEPVLNGATWNWGLDQIVLRAEELMPLLGPKTLLVTLRPESRRRDELQDLWPGLQALLQYRRRKAPPYRRASSENGRGLARYRSTSILSWTFAARQCLHAHTRGLLDLEERPANGMDGSRTSRSASTCNRRIP